MDFRAMIARSLAEATGLDEQEAAGMLETPPDPALGDAAFPCFRLAKQMRKAPQAIAAELAAVLAPGSAVKAYAAASDGASSSTIQILTQSG